MLLVRLRTRDNPTPRFGRVLPADPHTVELLDGDPMDPRGAASTGKRLPYTPDIWQADPSQSEVELLCPVVPSKVIGVGSNYKNHAKEMNKPTPDEPILFIKPTSALLDPGRPIVRPAGYERVDYEGELAVVVGTRLCKQPPERIAEHLLGYTICNDVTVRDLQKKDGQFTRAKGFDSFCPLGPAVVSAASFDPKLLRLRSRKNGTQVQDSLGDEMIFPVFELLSFISHVMTLLPGDVISTGTPAGVGNLTPGDVIEIEIAGIGVLRNPVVGGDAPPRAKRA